MSDEWSCRRKTNEKKDAAGEKKFEIGVDIERLKGTRERWLLWMLLWVLPCTFSGDDDCQLLVLPLLLLVLLLLLLLISLLFRVESLLSSLSAC